ADSGKLMAYFPPTGQVVLFGRARPGSRFGETWLWDGVTWTRWTPTGDVPYDVGDTGGMAYDAATGKLVMFGGRTTDFYVDDTWTWDGTNWTEQAPSTVPPARNFPGFAEDAARGVVVMFGGEAVSGELGDTWFWTGQDWTEVHPVRSPHGRDSASMAFDGARGDV